MQRLILMVGLPRSGKTTRALELSTKFGAPIVSPDAIRSAIHGSGSKTYLPKAEPLIWGIAKTMVSALFEAGHDIVIVDACNNTKKRRDEWRFGEWEVTFETVNTSGEICRGRTINPLLLPVIDRMERDHEPVDPSEEGS